VSVAIAVVPAVVNDAWCRWVVVKAGAEGCGSGREGALAARSREELEAGG
jgi:hypothetical protein